jgi:hypothetical protein
MISTKYTDCFNDVLPELPGVPPALAEYAIRNSVIEFCQRSTVWRVAADSQDVEAGNNTYDLEPPVGADVVDIIVLSVNGAPCDPVSEDALKAANPTWRTSGGTISAFMQQDTTSVVLARVPSETYVNGLEMTLALAPRRNSTSFPAWIWAKYFEGISAGAKAKLMRMPKKPWSDQQTALYYQSIFDAAAAGASADAARSLTRAAIRTTSHH